MAEQLMELPMTEAFQPTAEIGGAVGKTVLELLAQPAESFGPAEAQQPGRPGGPRPLRSTPTQQRTFDQKAKRPDTVPDISQE